MSEKTLTPAPESAAPRRERPRVRLAGLRDFALIPAIVVIAVVGRIVHPIFLQPDNLINILQTMSEISLLVLAQTIVLVAGRMDLSLESTFGLAPGVAAWLTVAVGSGADGQGDRDRPDARQHCPARRPSRRPRSARRPRPARDRSRLQ
ncbi:hypothetical protein GCM10017559_82770 [Streptosporangium longisporum]|uniref:ABC transporter permease n=1 Tax=Streptosporangium longisporum TaxID=46187 RepID=A0ABP6LJN0_9ACTN